LAVALAAFLLSLALVILPANWPGAQLIVAHKQKSARFGAAINLADALPEPCLEVRWERPAFRQAVSHNTAVGSLVTVGFPGITDCPAKPHPNRLDWPAPYPHIYRHVAAKQRQQ